MRVSLFGGGTFLGVPIIRIIVFKGLHWGPTMYRNYMYKNSSLGFRDPKPSNRRLKCKGLISN